MTENEDLKEKTTEELLILLEEKAQRIRQLYEEKEGIESKIEELKRLQARESLGIT